MKNKEIEELLNELKRRNERYNYCKNNDISFSDEDYKSYLLLSYIEQLETNRDKAIEYVKMHSNALGVLDTIKNDTLLDILGDKK